MTESAKPAAEVLDFGNDDCGGGYQLIDAARLAAMQSHALRAVLYSEEPVTVYDDPPDSPGAPGLREPQDGWISGHASRVARTVIVKQPRFLVRATEQSDALDALNRRVRSVKLSLEQAERDKKTAEKQRAEEAAKCSKAEKKAAELEDTISSLRMRVTADDREKQRLERLLSASEDTIARLRQLLGEELMDEVLDKAGTLDAAVAKRRALEALGPRQEDD